MAPAIETASRGSADLTFRMESPWVDVRIETGGTGTDGLPGDVRCGRLWAARYGACAAPVNELRAVVAAARDGLPPPGDVSQYRASTLPRATQGPRPFSFVRDARGRAVARLDAHQALR